MNTLLKCGILLAAILVAACSTINEQYFLRDQKIRSGPALDLPNYYRVTVEGKASGSSRYLAGWFNENAVDIYFNEIGPPENQAFMQTDDQGNKVVSVDGGNQDKKLVLLLSSNSDLIASQIGALAENEMLVDAFTRLANKPLILEGHQAGQQMVLLDARIGNIQTAGTSTILGLQPDASREQVEEAALNYLNMLSSQLGNTYTFESLEQARSWWQQQRNAIVNQ